MHAQKTVGNEYDENECFNFQKEARNLRNLNFYQGENVIEIVKKYKYLGIAFLNPVLFGLAVEQIACESNIQPLWQLLTQ